MAGAHNRGAIGSKVRAAIKYLLEVRDDLEEAARHAGISSTFRLRESLKRPHVRAFFAAEKRALLEIYSAQTPARLRDIAQNSENQMARVQAIKAMEQISSDEQDGRRQSALPAPGLVVVINSGPKPQIIEHGVMPAIEHRVDERQGERR